MNNKPIYHDKSCAEQCCLKITKQMLNAICPNKEADEELIKALNKYCCQYEINTLLRIAHFLSQTAHESDCFSKLTESMAYSEKRFLSLYKNTKKPNGVDFLKKETYIHLLNNDSATANWRYGYLNKEGKMVNHRGRGFLHMTWKNNYNLYSIEHNKKNINDIQDFVENPDLVANDINYAVESSCYWWNNLSVRGGSVNKYADKGSSKIDVYNVSWCVNSKQKQEKPFMPEYKEEANGLEDRWNKFEKIAKHLGLIK